MELYHIRDLISSISGVLITLLMCMIGKARNNQNDRQAKRTRIIPLCAWTFVCFAKHLET